MYCCHARGQGRGADEGIEGREYGSTRVKILRTPSLLPCPPLDSPKGTTMPVPLAESPCYPPPLDSWTTYWPRSGTPRSTTVRSVPTPLPSRRSTSNCHAPPPRELLAALSARSAQQFAHQDAKQYGPGSRGPCSWRYARSCASRSAAQANERLEGPSSPRSGPGRGFLHDHLWPTHRAFLPSAPRPRQGGQPPTAASHGSRGPVGLAAAQTLGLRTPSPPAGWELASLACLDSPRPCDILPVAPFCGRADNGPGSGSKKTAKKR